MKRVTRLFISLSLIPFVSMAATGPTSALAKPGMTTDWPVCTSDVEEYCIQTFEFTPQGGATRSITNVPNVSSPNVSVRLLSFNTPSPLPVPEQISVNFYNPASLPIIGATSDGMDEGTYRLVLRTGEFDPTLMLLKGYNSGYTVTKGADGYYTVDVSARPIPTAAVVAMDGDETMLNTCRASNWGSNCLPNQTVRRYINLSLMSSPLTEHRVGRGSWIATNASQFGTPNMDFTTGQISVEIAGPHYGPSDFNLPNQQLENGNVLNPAYFEMFVTYDLLAGMFGKMSSQTLTGELVKQFLESQTGAVQTTIQQSGSDVAQQATTTLGATGLGINFNLTHYSAPNPKVKFNTSGQKGSTIVSLPRTAKRGRTVAVKRLVTIPSGQTVRSIAIARSSRKVCSASKTSVKMLKKGTCSLTVTVVNKKGKRTKIAGKVTVN